MAVAPDPILAPGDVIRGGALDGSQEFFEIGVVGTTAGANNWPGAEAPTSVIDGVKGGGSKYLNFAETNTGILVTPTAGTSMISSMTLSVANDAEERDPANYTLYGTNLPISGGGPFDLSNFSLISTGSLALPSPRDTTADATGNDLTVPIPGSEFYTSYALIFPTVKNSNIANSMQISEVQFHGQVIPPPPPEIAVEQPSGNDLTDGSATVDFGQAVVGGTATRTFTIRNTAKVDSHRPGNYYRWRQCRRLQRDGQSRPHRFRVPTAPRTLL